MTERCGHCFNESRRAAPRFDRISADGRPSGHLCAAGNAGAHRRREGRRAAARARRKLSRRRAPRCADRLAQPNRRARTTGRVRDLDRHAGLRRAHPLARSRAGLHRRILAFSRVRASARRVSQLLDRRVRYRHAPRTDRHPSRHAVLRCLPDVVVSARLRQPEATRRCPAKRQERSTCAS